MNEDLVLHTKRPKGDDGHRTFSVRIPEDLVIELDQISYQTGQSRNALIARMIAYGIAHCKIEE